MFKKQIKKSSRILIIKKFQAAKLTIFLCFFKNIIKVIRKYLHHYLNYKLKVIQLKTSSKNLNSLSKFFSTMFFTNILLQFFFSLAIFFFCLAYWCINILELCKTIFLFCRFTETFSQFLFFFVFFYSYFNFYLN